MRADRVEVVQRAVGLAARQVVAEDRGDESAGAGGEDQRIVRVLKTRCAAHERARSIDQHHCVTQRERDAFRFEEVGRHHAELGRRPALDVRRQRHAIVGSVPFFADDQNAPAALDAFRPQRLEEPLADHAVTDDDHPTCFHDASTGVRSSRREGG